MPTKEDGGAVVPAAAAALTVVPPKERTVNKTTGKPTTGTDSNNNTNKDSSKPGNKSKDDHDTKSSNGSGATNGVPKHNGAKKNSVSGGSALSAPVPMQRSRSTPESGSPHQSPALHSQNNPHPIPANAFSPQAPIPLSHAWSFYLDDTNLWGVKSVEECLERMGYLGTVDNIQGFWCYWNAFEKKLLTEKKLGAMSCVGSMQSGAPPTPPPTGSPTAGSGGNGRYNWRIFNSVITPVWEDETHSHGGKFVLRCGHGDLRATKFIWTKIVLSMVGSSFLHQDIVCGCVLACRPHKKEIQVWIKSPPPKLKAPAVPIAPPTPAASAPPTNSDANTDSLPSDSPSSERVDSTSSTTSSVPSTTSTSPSSDSPTPSPAPTRPPIVIPTQPKVQVCTCHIDPIVCFANDIRFLLGVPLAQQPGNSGGVIKIEYIPHEVTMADVAARNKRLREKKHGRRESENKGSSADGTKKIAQNVSAKEKERLFLEKERAEREKRRKAEMDQEAAAKKKAAANPTAANGEKDNKTPPTISTKTESKPVKPITILQPQPRKHTWADASEDGGEIDLGIESSDYATSNASSNQSSVSSTPIHSGQFPSRTLQNGLNSPTSRAALQNAAGARRAGSMQMQRQSSDPTTTTGDIMHHLEALAKQDNRTFEGSVGDAGMLGARGPPILTNTLQSPAAIELMKKNKGQTPLKLSGERSYHPEPDSPGYNGTPAPSPSTTPFGFQTPVDGPSTPTPRSPFSAHSPRSGRDRIRADSTGGQRILTTRGAGRFSSGQFGAFSPESSPDGAYDDRDDSDLEDEQHMLQYDALSPTYENGHSFQLDRTRDLLRVPLDLESLSLPPAGKAPQRLKDPTSAAAAGKGTNSSSSIFAMVGRDGETVLAPHAVRGSGAFSNLIAAAQMGARGGRRGSNEGLSESERSAFAAPSGSHGSTPLPGETGSRKSSIDSDSNQDEVHSPGSANGGHSFSRKKPSPSPSSLPVNKKRTNKVNKVVPVEDVTPSTRRSKPRSLKTYLIWAFIATLVAVLIYLLFFTTLAPEDDSTYLLPEKTITDKGKIKLPKVHAK